MGREENAWIGEGFFSDAKCVGERVSWPGPPQGGCDRAFTLVIHPVRPVLLLGWICEGRTLSFLSLFPF